MSWPPKHITIVGVGLLGGSVGLAVRKAFPKAAVAGVGRRQSSLDEAMRCGAVDSAHLDLATPARDSDMVILATPVGAFERHLRALKPVLKRGAIVTDVGSTKARVVRLGERLLGAGGAFVGSHPMAGSERKGPAAARPDLLAGATCIITPTRHTPARLVSRVEAFWRALGMKTLRMGPAEHDRAVARVSHLPHALASLLTLLPREGDLRAAATGFRDSTRLAGGDAEMWRDIFLTNPKAVLAALDSLDELLCDFRDLVESGDSAGLERLLRRAKLRRDSAFPARPDAPGRGVE